MVNYIKPEFISLEKDPQFNEKWIQTKIEEDPSIIGLGEVKLKDSERTLPGRGRLDLLLFDTDINRRYEVELQLGSTDESHIIRTIEYWDLERKRYPQYDHCAVIIAEDITSRFFNVISLFNGYIPFIAIQMKAITVGDAMTLVFTKVLDEVKLGTEEQEEQVAVDREYWADGSTPEMMAVLDGMHTLAREVDSAVSLKYNKNYVGIEIDGLSKNFISFVPKRKSVMLQLKHNPSEEMQTILDGSELDMLTYNNWFNQYRANIYPKDLEESRDIILSLMRMAYDAYMGRTSSR